MSNKLQIISLPKELIATTAGANSSRVSEPIVEKCTLEGIDEVQILLVAPWTSLKMHGHDNQWEV